MAQIPTVAVVRPQAGLSALWRRVRDFLAPEVLAIGTGLIAWEIIGRLVAFAWFPPLTRVIARGVQLVQTGAIGTNVLASLAALAVGFTLALVVGIGTGVLMGRIPIVEIALGWYVNALLAAPSLVFVPILFIFFGISDATRVAVVFLYAVFVIIANTATAVHTADPQLLEMARAFGASRRVLFLRVILPDSLPLIMAGVRLGVGRAVKGMINGEMFIALVGLGAQIRNYGGSFDAAAVLAIVLLILAIAVIASWLVQRVDQKLTWWAN
jgi:NitT/TauT family transport system permease protein